MHVAYVLPQGPKGQILEIYSMYYRWRNDTKIILRINRFSTNLSISQSQSSGKGKFSVLLAEINSNNYHFKDLMKTIYIRGEGPKIISQPTSYQGKSMMCFQLMVGFDIGNSYVMLVDLSLLRANQSDPLSPANMSLIDDPTGGILIPLSKMMVAPI